METVYLIGDVHTVNAFRICGVEGTAADAESSGGILEMILRSDDVSVIVITRELAEPVSDKIRRVNFESSRKVIIEIPGIDDDRELGKSLADYVTEALGVAL